jgi:hypothetical protein
MSGRILPMVLNIKRGSRNDLPFFGYRNFGYGAQFLLVPYQGSNVYLFLFQSKLLQFTIKLQTHQVPLVFLALTTAFFSFRQVLM